MKWCNSHSTRNIFNLYMRRFFFGLVYYMIHAFWFVVTDMVRVWSWLGMLLVLIPGVTSWYFFNHVGCHVYSSTGMCGYCGGGCWPYFNLTLPCGGCMACEECEHGHRMDELCRCTHECPLGKYGANCDVDCPYRCRSCDRTTGECLLWCSSLCLDGACHLSTGYCQLNMTTLLAHGCGYNNSSRCEEYSRANYLVG